MKLPRRTFLHLVAGAVTLPALSRAPTQRGGVVKRTNQQRKPRGDVTRGVSWELFVTAP